MASQSLIPA